MDLQPPTDAPHGRSGALRRTTPARVPGFPAWTHLIAAIAFPIWSIGMDAYEYGIDSGYDWWPSFDGLGPALLVVVLLFVLPPAVVLEAGAVLGSYPRIAKAVVICYVVIAGFIVFIPTGLRFFGDMSPTPIGLETSSLAWYGIVMGAQAIFTYVVCRRWLRWRTPR